MVENTAADPNNIIPLPAQKMYLCTRSQIVHDVTNVLILSEMKNEVQQYYDKHHNIPKSSLQNVEWEANKLAMMATNEISYCKTFHNLRNTMPMNKKRKRIGSDLCPMCNSKPETIQHLLSCTH